MSKRPKLPERPRTTVPLTGTISRPHALLDHKATVSLTYATKVASRELALTVPASGIVRRALVLYAHQLAGLDPGQLKSEAYAVRDSCKALPIPQEDTQAALAQLEGVPTLPSLQGVLNGSQAPIDWAAFHDRVDALVAQMRPTKSRTLKKEPTP